MILKNIKTVVEYNLNLHINRVPQGTTEFPKELQTFSNEQQWQV